MMNIIRNKEHAMKLIKKMLEHVFLPVCTVFSSFPQSI